ncbi:hypothetical protein KKF84_07690 [Myxococcota bacterium]|nr:hypothetical protein [Myxococcota bacterium]MBU1535187.1 hypothetical protein [Myxococcota bacterium]
MNNENAFNYTLRVLLCSQCGASISLPREGNVATCEFCNTEMLIETETPRANPLETARLDEVVLMKSWWSQVTKPTREQSRYTMEWPPELEWTKRSTPDKARQAFEEAFAAERLNHEQDFTHQMRLTFLACVLSNHYMFTQETFSARAILDTTLNHVMDPGFRQILFARMVRCAAFAQDHESAAHWLDELDCASPILSLHNEYMAAVAFECFARGDMEGILESLGQTDIAVPITPESGTLLGIMRIHALDELGRRDDAIAEMTILKSKYKILELFSTLKTLAMVGIAVKALQRERRSGRRILVITAGVLLAIIGLVVFLIL